MNTYGYLNGSSLKISHKNIILNLSYIFGLPQAGRFAHIKIVKHLADICYFPTGHTPGLLRHLTRPTRFNVFFDKFGANFFGKHYADHLIDT